MVATTQGGINMQRKIGSRRLPIGLVTLILAIVVAWTLPFAISATTMARYVAEAAISPSARVARWDVVFSPQPATAIRHENITVFHTHVTATHANPMTIVESDAEHILGPISRTFSIFNNSQVTADIENIVMRYVINDTTTPTVASPTVAGSSHPSGAHNITFTPSANVQALAGGRFRHQFGATGTYTIHIQATDIAQPHPAIRWYRVFFDAVQVD